MHIKHKDTYFAINTFGISAVEVFWGIGLPVIIESTFLQLFLKNLGASNITIGLIPAIFSCGMAVFSLFSAYFTSHLVHKRRAVILSHLLGSLPFMLFGLFFYHYGKTWFMLPVFLIFYSAYAMSIGIAVPLWLNFLMKIFSDKKTIPAVAIMYICQWLSRLCGSFFIVKLVQQHAFSEKSSAMVFIFIGLIFFAGSFFFLFTKEVNSNEENIQKSAHNPGTMVQAVINIIHNRQFIIFSLSTIEAYTCITVISFYAAYATRYYSIPDSIAAGLFMVFIYGAGMIAYIFLGLLNYLNLKNKIFISKIFALSAVLILLFTGSLPGFLTASFFLGFSRAISTLCYSPVIKKLSGLGDATDYFAVSQVLLIPLGIGIPVLSGLFLDNFSYLGIISYKILFGICCILIIISIICVLMIKFDNSK
jgi:predicted MFS family arabinose efflux permease